MVKLERVFFQNILTSFFQNTFETYFSEEQKQGF